MTPRRAIELGTAFVAGVLLTLLLPAGWLGGELLGALAVTLVLAVLAAASVEDPAHRRFGIGLVLFLTLGTGRPRAQVADAMALRLFLVGASLIAGLACGVFLMPLR